MGVKFSFRKGNRRSLPIVLTGRVRFPRGRQFALTWGIPDEFGGMTEAMLQRCRAFTREGELALAVLTLDDRPDYPELEERLRSAGELTETMTLLNIWDWMREHGVRPKAKSIIPPAPLDAEEGDACEIRDGVVIARRRDVGDGTEEVDRFRSDGTLLLTDRTSDGERSIVAYSADGTPIREWTSLWAVYRYWLDRLTGGKRSFIVVDSKTAARFIHSYRRDNVVTMHVLHGSHRRGGVAGRLSASRRDAVEHASEYDALVTLTDRQSADLKEDGAQPQCLFVIPNSRASGARPEQREHVRGTGVMLASLTKRKRIGHAVKAIGQARARGADVRLDIYGEGPEHDQIARLIHDLQLGDAVRLHPFDRDAGREFARADFSLLSSTSEGLPLVLVESMASGCIPIAYDMRYGPADIITHGRDGILAANGDVDDLARRILQFADADDARVERMRRRARMTTRRYSDRAVTRRWARAMEVALEAKRIRAQGELTTPLRARKALGRAKRRLWRVTGLAG